METKPFHQSAERFPDPPEDRDEYEPPLEPEEYESHEPTAPEREVREDELAWQATHRPEARDANKHLMNVIKAIERGEAKEGDYEKRAEIHRDRDDKEAAAEPQSASPIGSVLREQASSRPGTLPKPPEDIEKEDKQAKDDEIPDIFDTKSPTPLYGKYIFAGFAIALFLMAVIILIGVIFG